MNDDNLSLPAPFFMNLNFGYDHMEKVDALQICGIGQVG